MVNKKRVLILGVTGMLGSTVFKLLSAKFDTWGTVRSLQKDSCFYKDLQQKIISGVDVLDQDQLISVLDQCKPDIVINCVGVIKQLPTAQNPLVVLPINSMLPHRLARLCHLQQSRLIHISTDCVFSGKKGMYTESDLSDAYDLYGKSKYIGELNNYDNSITLRTSIIGHELNSKSSLIDWFLDQSDQVKGYKDAIFSGLPTIELATVIRDLVIPNDELSGLYHVSAEPIDKCSLLKLVADVYNKDILVEEDTTVKINRSLNSEKFRKETGYIPPLWPDLIKKMYEFYRETN